MKTDNIFVSGEEYSLTDIFGSSMKVVVPDMQRDYCWGKNTYDKNKRSQGELVTQFANGLIESYKASPNDKMTLGLLYGYEAPKGQLQLCDGQQRLTTLYLLLGILYRMTGCEQLKRLLILGDKRKVGKAEGQRLVESAKQETGLQYAIRESTLYFLQDLVHNYFINKEGVDIEKASWYYNEYNQDDSIKAMIGAVKAMEELCNNFDGKELARFSEFVTNNLKFVYFDMGDRRHGEETFVVINTTGEPLSPSENLKPVLIGNIKDVEERKKRSEEWEMREEWLWKHRDRKRENTSDELSNDFYTWFWQIRLRQEHVMPKKQFLEQRNNAREQSGSFELTCDLDDVQKQFIALSTLLKTIQENDELSAVISSLQRFNDDSDTDILKWLRKNANLDILLPLIRFCEKYDGKPDFVHSIIKFMRRLAKNHLDKTHKRKRNDGGAYLDWRYVIQIIDQTDNVGQLIAFNSLQAEAFDQKIANVPPCLWYDFDEQMKDKYAACGLNISLFEQCSFLRFDLSVLWGRGDFTIQEIENRYENIRKLYGCLVGQESISAELANMYRFYRFIRGWGDRVGHVPYYTWAAEGVTYNFHNYETAYVQEFNDEEFSSLLSEDTEDNIVNTIGHAISKKFNIDELKMSENTTPQQYLEAWLLVKTLLANEKGEKLDYWNGRAIGCYISMSENKLNNACGLSLINSCPGYLARDGVNRVGESYYHNPRLLDTPLYIGIVNDVNYSDFENQRVPKTALSSAAEETMIIFANFKAKYEV